MTLFCYAYLCAHSSFAIIWKRKSKLDALLLLSYRCIVTLNVFRLFLAMPFVDQQYVIVVFPDHTHLLFNKHIILTYFLINTGVFFVLMISIPLEDSHVKIYSLSKYERQQ